MKEESFSIGIAGILYGPPNKSLNLTPDSFTGISNCKAGAGWFHRYMKTISAGNCDYTADRA